MKKRLEISQTDRTIIQKLPMKKPYVWVATWFGSGFMRPAPGTWGSLAALPFGILMLVFANVITLLAAILFITLIGWWSARHFERDSGVHDSKMIVVDEVAGQWLSMLPIALLLPVNAPYLPVFIVFSFILFRFFDITKIWPVNFFDKKVGGAVGVMADDIMAGIYAAIILTGIIYGVGSG